jgi:hypothetical protein
VWSPGQKQEFKLPEGERGELPIKDEPISPVWTPKSATSSPTVERKEFRPVKFESPVLSRKGYSKEVREVGGVGVVVTGDCRNRSRTRRNRRGKYPKGAATPESSSPPPSRNVFRPVTRRQLPGLTICRRRDCQGHRIRPSRCCRRPEVCVSEFICEAVGVKVLWPMRELKICT